MKKFIILSMSAIFAINIANAEVFDPNSKIFRDGFEAGLNALDFQKRNDGVIPTEIDIHKPYLLVLYTKRMPTNEALFLQVIAHREGIESYLTKDFITFGSYEKEIDAQDVAKLLESKFKLKSNNFKIERNVGRIYTYPYLWSKVYGRLLEEALSRGVIIDTKILGNKSLDRNVVYINRCEADKAPVEKFLTFKNPRAMGYALTGRDTNSKSYTEISLMNVSNAQYAFEKEITTIQGETFFKVKNQNLYFSNSDISGVK